MEGHRTLFALSRRLIDALDLGGASRDDGQSAASLIPRDTVDDVLAQRPSEIASQLAAQLERGFAIHQPEVILASKTRGRRPIALLSPWERVTYRALVALLEPLLPRLSRSAQAYTEFKNAPTDHPHTAFVVMADIASCYQYIDHGLLESELVNQTGNARAAAALVELLGALTQRSFGLPQNRLSSHQLAETVLTLIDRRLRRSGLTVWRYSDDFRVAAGSRRLAHEALELIDHHLRLVGLTVNEEKTSVRSSAKYAQWAQGVQRRIDTIEADFDIDFDAFSRTASEYDQVDKDQDEPGSSDDPDDAQTVAEGTSAEAAIALLEHWANTLDEAGVRARFGPDAVVDREVVSNSLGVLRSRSDARGLRFCRRVLDSDPSLTPAVARYLRRIIGDDLAEVAVDDVIDSSLTADELFISDWQALWLMEPLRRSSGLTRNQLSWLQNCLAAQSSYLRSSAADVLAVHGRVTEQTLHSLFDEVPVGSRPKVVSALARTTGSLDAPGLANVTDARPLYRMVAETVIAE